MLFQRLFWCALGVALLLGSVQSVFQQFQTVPLILAAEVFEDAKGAEPARAAAVAPAAPAAATAHEHAPGTPAHEHPAAAAATAEHEHGGEEWSPANGFERNGWTWVANVLHALSMALLALAVMAAWTWKRSSGTGNFRLALAVAAAGWLSIHFWPSLGLHAEVPGMEAAPLHARQAWWLLAAVSSALACATVAFGTRSWRFVPAIALLALPFLVGAPQHTGDALAGFTGEAHAQLEALGRQFIWATTWLSISFWGVLGLLCAVAFPRWVKPVLTRQQPAGEPAIA
jgi:cobalt transporter subunit CbtA